MLYFKDVLTNHDILITDSMVVNGRVFVEFCYDGVGKFGAFVSDRDSFKWNGQTFFLNDFCEV